MRALTLYFAPDSCARVPLIALEEIGCPYRLEIVAFMSGQHRSAEYLALNPKGKVPTLLIDGEALTENVAILLWLADHFPAAGLLPPAEGMERYRQISDLAFCASGLHPIVTRLRIPQFFCDIDSGRQRVFEMAEAMMKPNFALIDRRLSGNRWWYGDQWSIVDAYINWVWFRVSGTAFDHSDFPHFARHNADMAARPAVIRALAASAAVAAQLEERGLAVKLSGPGAISAK